MDDLHFITDPNSWKDITPDMYDEINAQIEQTFDEGCHGQCSSCESGCDSSNQLPVFAKRMYAVTGGKGGTGKSTVTALLAGALARRGLKVGVLDCDLPCSAIPQLMGLHDRVLSEENKMSPVVTPEGIEVMSMNLIAEDRAEPVLWAGIDTFNVVNYLYTGTTWGELDVMLLDMPSGAADVPLNLYTSFPVDGSIIVTEPGTLPYVATQRTINMTSMLMSRPVAYVENRALDTLPVSADQYALPAGCLKLALPLDAAIAAGAEEGALASAEVPALAPLVELIAKAVADKPSREG